MQSANLLLDTYAVSKIALRKSYRPSLADLLPIVQRLRCKRNLQGRRVRCCSLRLATADAGRPWLRSETTWLECCTLSPQPDQRNSLYHAVACNGVMMTVECEENDSRSLQKDAVGSWPLCIQMRSSGSAL